MQSAIKTCLAVAMLTASVEALDIERRGGGKGGRGRGRGRGRHFSCEKYDDIVDRMTDYADGDADQLAIVTAFEAAVDCSDTGAIAVAEAAAEAARETAEAARETAKTEALPAKISNCSAWCQLKGDGDASECDASCEEKYEDSA